MSGVLAGMLRGAAAGAAGTTALNAVSYLDMAIRGRPTSSAPEDTVTALADKTGISIPGDGDTRTNRIAGLGPLAGLVTGIGVGALLGAARAAGWRPGLGIAAITAAAAAMLGSDGPMTALGISDPRTWAAEDWLADVIPHLAYGLATAGVAHGLDRD
jgi:hypothetical protein